MARTPINYGTTPGDGTGDVLFTSFTNTDANFIDIYNVHGWANYADAETTPATQSITTTASKLQIDGGGANSNSAYLPREIRGSSELWDTTNDKIIPISLGDSYMVRVGLEVTAKTGAAGTIYIQLDIGGAATPTIVVLEEDISIAKTVPFSFVAPFPIFCLSTFIANGGQIFLSSDTGTITIAERNISIYRMSKGDV